MGWYIPNRKKHGEVRPHPSTVVVVLGLFFLLLVVANVRVALLK